MSEAIKVQEFFRYRIEPYTDQEIPRCAYCAKKLQVRYADYIELLPADATHEILDGFKSQARQNEVDFTTNKRIIWRKVEWGYRYTAPGDPPRIYHGNPDQYETRPWVKVPRIIRLTFYNDRPERWGCDGKFCSGSCVASFAHAALRAGYRIVKNENPS